MNRHRRQKPQKYLPGDHPWRKAARDLGCVACLACAPLILAAHGTDPTHVRQDNSIEAAVVPHERQVTASQVPFAGSPLAWSPRVAVHDVSHVDPLPEALPLDSGKNLPQHHSKINRVEHLHHHVNDAPERHRSSERPGQHHMRERSGHGEHASGHEHGGHEHGGHEHGGHEHGGHEHGGHEHGGHEHGGHGGHGR